MPKMLYLMPAPSVRKLTVTLVRTLMEITETEEEQVAVTVFSAQGPHNLLHLLF